MNQKMQIRNPILMAVVLFSMAAGSSVASADPPPWAGEQDRPDKHHGDDHRGEHGDRGHDHYQISTREQYFIRDWYHRHGYHALQLPPGQVKKLYRGAPWPPPYAYAPLPDEIVRGLQPLPPGYRYYQVGADVVIANLAGRVVTDVVYDVLNR